MQIHELQLHRLAEAQISEAGPPGVFNLGREILKNPKALISAQALGAAQQAATQRYAAKLAPKVTQQAAANIAPLARQLAAGWQQIAKTLPGPKSVQSEPVALPPNYNIPAVQRKQQAQAAQQAQTVAPAKTTTVQEPYTVGGQTIDPSDPIYARIKQQQAEIERREQQLQAQKARQQSGKAIPPEQFWNKTGLKEDAASDYRDSFVQYARRVLGARGVDTTVLGRDQKINTHLDFILQQIVELGNQPQQQAAKVEEYFNTALTYYHQMIKDPAMYQQLNPQSTAKAGRQSAVQASDADQQLQQTLDQIGISKAVLQKLAQTATDAAQGNNGFNPTGNPIIDAVLKSAGMRPTQ